MKKPSKLPKILAIVGPTASGKSALAVNLAKTFNGEVISADSRQVYVGLDIGTGKITTKEMFGIPHHLLDVADPKKQFTVSDYKKLADQAIADVLARGKLPILCGGTGFYIEAVAKNVLLPDVPVNPDLRKKLSKKTAAQLFTILKKLDPKRAEAVGRYNGVRLIRAIEIAKTLGKVPPVTAQPKYHVITIGLKVEKEKLKKKIHNRLISRIKNGMISEAKKLHQKGLSWKRMNELGLEYRALALHLTGKLTEQQLIETLDRQIYQYARRQTQWFKRDKSIIWFEV